MYLVPGPGLVPGAVGSYPIKPVINPGDLSATFTLTPLNDSLVEANETVVFTVLNVTSMVAAARSPCLLSRPERARSSTTTRHWSAFRERRPLWKVET